MRSINLTERTVGDVARTEGKSIRAKGEFKESQNLLRARLPPDPEAFVQPRICVLFSMFDFAIQQ